MISDNLKHLGLSQVEVSVFLAVLKNNPCHVISIFKETGKHRQIIYNVLDSLLKKGLIIVSKKHGKNLYAIGDPHTILIDIEQKEIIAKETIKYIEQNTASEKEGVESFIGADSYIEAMKSFRLHAENEKEFIIFGGQSKDWFSLTEKVFENHLNELKRMKRNGIDIFVLYFEEEWKEIKDIFIKYVKDPYTVKVLKGEKTLPHAVWMAGDHIYILTPVKEPIVVHIKSPELSKRYHEHFWKSWRKGELVKN